MRILHEKQFPQLKYMMNMKKTSNPQEVAVCTQLRGLQFLKYSSNVFNCSFNLLPENYYGTFMVQSMVEIQKDMIAVLIGNKDFIGVVDRKLGQQIHEIQIPHF